jgi:peptide/nickel transport system ATP-binding protein
VSEQLIRTEGLTRHFKVGKLFASQVLHAVDEVNFEIGRGEIVALVGESGSGKSTIARLLARVYKPTRGEIYFEGGRWFAADAQAAAGLRERRPDGLPGPVLVDQPCVPRLARIKRALRLHRKGLGRPEVERVLGEVGLVPPGTMAGKFPHELSGGQRQRVGFAQALPFSPKLIIADEPVSMLDVSIRIGLLNLMSELREREGVSILYITHDVASARYIADRVLVMYAGHLVEEGPVEDVIQRPKHPYTQLLLSAVPDPRAPLGVSDAADVGEPPKVINPKEGCRFRPRCPYAIAECETVTPLLRPLGPGRLAACHVAEADVGEPAAWVRLEADLPGRGARAASRSALYWSISTRSSQPAARARGEADRGALVGHGSSDAAASYGVYAFGLLPAGRRCATRSR